MKKITEIAGCPVPQHYKAFKLPNGVIVLQHGNSYNNYSNEFFARLHLAQDAGLITKEERMAQCNEWWHNQIPK
jgi:hypothetical protein